MNPINIDTIRKKVKENQSEKRYEHTMGVMYTAAALAMRYHVDVEKALLAGLLHDCAKAYSTNLEHAKRGAQMARDEYGIDDTDITDAIFYHTTGRPNMTLLDKIIYIADYMEPNRCEAPNLDEIRRLAFEDIDECLYKILEASLKYLKGKDVVIDPITEETYLYYKKQMNK